MILSSFFSAFNFFLNDYTRIRKGSSSRPPVKGTGALTIYTNTSLAVLKIIVYLRAIIIFVGLFVLSCVTTIVLQQTQHHILTVELCIVRIFAYIKIRRFFQNYEYLTFSENIYIIIFYFVNIRFCK